ncbi:hypothetical protein G9A89_021505 [Geosiphon pyriformis]|nr:hypothetical protein G9A89_021505 [Geosiphon pyriformis]
MAVENWDTWMFRNCFRALLFTLPVETTAHNLGTFLKGTGEKTCVINHSLKTDNWTHCVIIGFGFENELESAFCTVPIYGDMRLSWARLDLVWCKKCGKFGHSALEYDAFNTLMLYAKKNVLIFCSAAFSDKLWAQVVSSASFSSGLQFDFGSGSGFFSFGALNLDGGSLFVLTNNSSLNTHLASLERSLELLSDQVSDIVHKFSSIKLMSLALFPSSAHSVAPIIINLDSNLNIVLDGSIIVPTSFSVVSALGLSSLKILMTKVGCLKSKLVALEASTGLVLAKLDQLCAGSDFWMFFASQ